MANDVEVPLVDLVIKVGGELLDPVRADEARAIASDLKKLIERRHRVVVVHGGGPQTSALQRALGQTPRIVGGRRITDAEALDAIKMVVGGKLNVDACSLLRAAGVMAVGLHGVSGHLIHATKRPPKRVTGGGDAPIDFGYVGDVTGINQALLALLIDQGYTPVLACIGSDELGQAYNINADSVASAVAGVLAADKLMLVTGTPGVLERVEDPSSRIPVLTGAEAKNMIDRGSVSGGMIPKLEESFLALARGVREVHILGHVEPGDLLLAVDSPDRVGTRVRP